MGGAWIPPPSFRRKPETTSPHRHRRSSGRQPIPNSTLPIPNSPTLHATPVIPAKAGIHAPPIATDGPLAANQLHTPHSQFVIPPPHRHSGESRKPRPPSPPTATPTSIPSPQPPVIPAKAGNHVPLTATDGPLAANQLHTPNSTLPTPHSSTPPHPPSFRRKPETTSPLTATDGPLAANQLHTPNSTLPHSPRHPPSFRRKPETTSPHRHRRSSGRQPIPNSTLPIPNSPTLHATPRHSGESRKPGPPLANSHPNLHPSTPGFRRNDGGWRGEWGSLELGVWSWELVGGQRTVGGDGATWFPAFAGMTGGGVEGWRLGWLLARGGPGFRLSPE